MKRSSLFMVLSELSLGLVAVCAALGLCAIIHARVPRVPSTPDQQATPQTTVTQSVPSQPLTGTEIVFADAQILPADPYDLARRLKRLASPRGATPEAPIQYAVGDHASFWTLDLAPAQSFQISATLRYISPRLYMWVQDDISVAQDALEQSAAAFESRLYPAVRQYFGSEWTPGIDNDGRLTILHANFSGATGYFSSSDEYSKQAVPYSNQREMFYINPAQARPGSDAYEGTLAHEFQHMVHWHADPNEDAWINEGDSELAMYLCGYSREDRIQAFASNPDTPLTQWESSPGDATIHYGAAFLFMDYFVERFGPDMMRELVANPLNGRMGFDTVLQAHQVPLSFDDLFSDWTIANYLNKEQSSKAANSFQYRDLTVQAKAERSWSSFPVSSTEEVHQYATDYIELEPQGQDLSLRFFGMATTHLVPNQPRSGRYEWWSNRGDNSDSTLTRTFDLTKLSTATLEAWLWYDIEEGWDYAYVEISTDAGQTWQILPGKFTTTDDPSGNSYGAGYTGISGGSTSENPSWVQDSYDLTPFTGHTVCIRFEYLTDEAVNRAGLCIDDVRIPQLGYLDDAENGDDGWTAQGFMRHDNTLPQHYAVQLIRLGNQITVEHLPLREDQSGEWPIRGLGSQDKVVLAVSALTPGSTEKAAYHYEIQPLP